ncbi:hypothetical protein ADUPG1_000755, partial [Aduncisulcus paluster]
HMHHSKWRSRWTEDDFKCTCPRFLACPVISVITPRHRYSLAICGNDYILHESLSLTYDQICAEFASLTLPPPAQVEVPAEAHTPEVECLPIAEDDEFIPLEDDFGLNECYVPSEDSDLTTHSLIQPPSSIPDVSSITDYVDFHSMIPIEERVRTLIGKLTHTATLLFARVIRRQLSDTLYRSLRSAMITDKKEYGTMYSLPSLKTVHQLRKSVMRSNRQCSFKYDGETVNFTWRSPISVLPSFVFHNFQKFRHFSPYITVPKYDESDPHCCSYRKYYEIWDHTRKQIALEPFPCIDKDWEPLTHPDYFDYVRICEKHHVTPVFIIPILVFMDGVMTCRVGHTALTIRWTLANVENAFKTKDFAWKEISVLPENGQIDTSAFLTELVTDAVALQKGFDVVINGTTVR